ncbi:MAG TPA: hypothetical protein VGQ33_07555, partial [Vicinamibacteria bacterium]|nr:hypothetical protein [Vicinamibacteria bacterium]
TGFQGHWALRARSGDSTVSVSLASRRVAVEHGALAGSAPPEDDEDAATPTRGGGEGRPEVSPP